MKQKQSFNPVPLILIGVTTGSFAVISVFFINWKGAVIEETNSLQQPIEINFPTTPVINDQPVEKVEEVKATEPTYEATVFVPKYEPILPSGVQQNSPAWYCWQSGGGRDCLLRDWNYTSPPNPPNEWDEFSSEQEQKKKSKWRLFRWLP